MNIAVRKEEGKIAASARIPAKVTESLGLLSANLCKHLSAYPLKKKG